MSRSLDDLNNEFRALVETVIQNCEQRGFIMRPYFTLRTPFEQAKLWRQSRSIEEIQRKIDEFTNLNANFLAHCVESVGPQSGDPVTEALPGFSWHQWGEAVDCFWLVNGQAEWSSNKKINGENGYRIYAEVAQSLGLTAGGLWSSLKDWPHIQLRPLSNPGKMYSIQAINDAMRNRFET